MAIRLGSTVINCADMELMTRFWSQALHLVPSSAEDGDDFRVLRGDRVNLSLQLSRTPVSARDQMHLDLYSGDQAAEVRRLTGLGAAVVRHHDDPEDDYVVMTDPEGNQFCVCAVAVPGGGAAGTDLGFRGEVADLYHRYRHGYPPAVIDVLADAFELTAQDLVVDLGCGTGQLALPIAGRVRAVIGVDPEPDMLQRARQAARDAGVSNVSWMLGADTDLPALGGLYGGKPVAAVTIGQALHWMRHEELFRSVVPLVRPGGGVAVVTNGTPLWLQESAWSRALSEFLERWFGAKPTNPCGTDEPSQRKYAEALARAGFEVSGAAVDYVAELSLDQIVGGIYSALPVDRLPAPDQRPAFAEQVRAAVGARDRFAEPVRVAMLIGRIPR